MKKLSVSFLPNPIIKTLSNNIKLYIQPREKCGLSSIQIWVKTGSADEGIFLGSGISHYIEHVVFKGTKKYTGENISKIINELGGQINAYTSFDRTVFYIDLPTESIESAFDILSEITLNPLFSKKDVEQERDVILREMDMYNDDPDSRLQDATFKELFQKYPYRYPIIGELDLFKKLTVNDLKNYHKARYTSDNINIVVSSDSNIEIIEELAEKYFSKLQNSISSSIFIPNEPIQIADKTLVLQGNSDVLHANLIWKIPNRLHPDFPALFVLSNLLGNGNSSLLYKNLTEKHQLVYDIESSLFMTPECGLLFISYEADCGKREKINDIIYKTIKKENQKGWREKEIKKVIQKFLISLINKQKNVSSIATLIGNQYIIQNNSFPLKNFIEEIEKVTPADIKKVCQKYIFENAKTDASLDKIPPQNIVLKKSTNIKKNNINKTILKNGIQLITHIDKSLPKVALFATLKAGGAFEEKSVRGLSALLSRALKKETAKMSSTKTAEIVDSIGASFHSIVADNSISLLIETLSTDLKTAAQILCNSLFFPEFKEKTISFIKSQIITDIKDELEDLDSFADICRRKYFFNNYYLNTFVLGTEKTIQTISLKNLQDLYSNIFHPKNLIISAVGDFNETDLINFLNSLEIPEFKNKKSYYKKQSPASQLKAQTIMIPKAVSQCITSISFPCPGFSSEKEYHTITLLSAILNNMDGHLYKEIREKRSLAYFVSTDIIADEKAGMFSLVSGNTKENAQLAINEMQKEIKRIKSGGITQNELTNAIRTTIHSQRFALQNIMSRANLLAKTYLFNLQFKNIIQLEEQYKTITLKDITTLAQKYFSDDAKLTLFVGNIPADNSN